MGREAGGGRPVQELQWSLATGLSWWSGASQDDQGRDSGPERECHTWKVVRAHALGGWFVSEKCAGG